MNDRTDEVHEDAEVIDDRAAPASPQNLDPQPDAADVQWAQLEAKLKNGAHWFYWIAALSVINSLIILAEGERQFVVGLGITHIANAIALEVAKQSPDAAMIAKVVAVVFTVIVASVFAGLGFASGKRYSWVFVVGMLLYLIDALIYLVAGIWLSFAFHLFVMTRLFSGLQACREMNAAERETALADA